MAEKIKIVGNRFGKNNFKNFKWSAAVRMGSFDAQEEKNEIKSTFEIEKKEVC